MVTHIKKRDGRLQKFNATKIADAINSAYGNANDIQALLYAAEIANTINSNYDGIIDIEVVQDEVEKFLMRKDQAIAKKYILYRKDRERVRNAKGTVFNYKKLVEDYLHVNDWRVKENSTVNYSLGGLIISNSGAVVANYWLSEVYDKEIADAHRSAAIHIHDLSMLAAYCAGWDIERIIKDGVGGVEGKITSLPAKHLHTLSNQLVNFLGIMQNEWAGAQAFSSFDTYLAPFVKADNLTYAQTKQAIQSFIYGVNTPSRWGSQAPFSNITLDWIVPSDLAEKQAIVGGKEMDFKYKDCQKEMDMVNKAFLEVMIEGDANGRGFQYPIPTYSITRDFDWNENENNQLLFEMTSKYGTPYFSNYINSDMEPSDVRSMCCRLRLDLRELRKKGGGFFGSGANTGSIGVVTLNMPRLAYLSETEDAFFAELNRLMDLSARSLKVKRDIVSKLLEDGLYPYTRVYLGNFNNHFSTIGLVGMNEACLNAKWLKKNLSEKEAQAWTVKVLNYMRERLSDYQEKYGDLYNLEATPAESTAFRFAKHDKANFPEIVTALNTDGTPFYTNSSHLPVDFTASISEALTIQDEMQTLYTSGTVFHTFLGQKLPSWQSAATLVKKIAENYRLPYFTLSPTYSICPTHGYIAGEVNVCPQCKHETEVYSRITGYYRPLKNWNDGKKAEFDKRLEYDVVTNSEVGKANEEKAAVTNLVVSELLKDVQPGKDYLLFTTKTCPNCRLVKVALDDQNVKYTVIDAEENVELSQKYKIKTVPTLIRTTDVSYEAFVNYSNIVRHLKYKDE